MKHNIKSLTAIVASMALSAASASAQAVVQGTTITFDFGNTADNSGPGVNNISAAQDLIPQNGSLTSVVNSANTALAGVTFAWSRPSTNPFNNNQGIVSSSSPAWVTAQIADSWMGSTPDVGNVGFTLTISGLNTSLSYDLSMGGAFGTSGANTTYTINGIGITNVSNGSTPYITHQNIFTTSGNIVITGTQTVTGGAAVISGLQIVAIPEPSSALLGGLGALVLLRRRR